MSSATIRAAFRTVVKAVSGVGAIHTWERFSNDSEAFFKKHFTRAKKVNGWIFRVFREKAEVLTCSEDERPFVVVLRGWLSADAATKTQHVAENLRDSICNTLDQNPTLSGVSGLWAEKAEPEDIVTGMTQFGSGNVRVHAITIRIRYRLRSAVTYV
jgi:hypothetical protein